MLLFYRSTLREQKYSCIVHVSQVPFSALPCARDPIPLCSLALENEMVCPLEIGHVLVQIYFPSYLSLSVSVGGFVFGDRLFIREATWCVRVP